MNLNDLFKHVVLKMYGEMCHCGREATAIHHIWPKGMGGCSLNTRYNPLNGIPLCEKCHSRIHDEIGEVKGREEIIANYPHLEEANHMTCPFEESTERFIRKQLKEMLK